ncbi:hypothetical protein [Pseudomonas izuensis]|uniref:Uncharacterized protein n=1 Tax=Pseudomonas izuensis TaxID=2684212 RepID=A0ABM7RSF8_9PSED|nr:hypothetical protein [Pseudomonas izuensis]BCX68049.1 hypothetical protein LAB08_R26890 [Pseudomonas izuensis]
MSSKSSRTMPAPWTDPAPLPDIVGGETNLMPRLAWIDPANPLKVKFAPWSPSNPSVGDPESVRIYLDDSEIGFKEWTATIRPDDHFVSISADKLTQGEHQLTYVMTNWLGTPDKSLPFIITIDKLEPQLSNPNKLVFPAEVAPPPKKITAAYLTANQDKVLATLPRYTDPKPGDVIRWYWGTSQGDLNEADFIVLDNTNYLQPVIVVVTGELIRDRKDGNRYASYRVWDRAGNPSVHSEVVELDVEATPKPRILPPSKVKEANGGATSGVLTPSTAVNGVTVQIPATAVINDGERTVVMWAEGTAGEFITETPVAVGSRDYKIPKDRIAQHLGKTIVVKYNVFEPGVVDPHKSDNYSLRVEELTGLPTIQCDKVSGGKLSLASITDGFANFTLASWTFMATDQYLTVTVEGVDSNTQPLVIPVLTESPVPAVAQSIPAGRISKADLQRFKLNLAIQVVVKVSFDNKQSWKSFPKLQPQLIA